jgi:hypothetical protein
MPCYSGPIPVTDDERIAIWKWAKANGIDHGLPFDKIHDAINQHFFAGQAKPEWINDILSGRKTPFRQLSNAAWKAQYNRRQTVLTAKDAAGQRDMHPVMKGIKRVWDAPRSAAVFGHSIVFPVTHGGDLALRPASWGVFFRGLMNTYTKSWSKAATERLLDTMKRQPLFDTALRSGLDVGERAHRTDLVNRTAKGSPSERAWSILTTMRFELWNHEMEKYIKPGMSEPQVLEIGKNMAEWANHATGSAKGPISNLGGNVLFGPKLTQSKLNRIFSDPVKTVKTFGDWKNASPGEKAAAWTRLSGGMQYLGSGLGLLAVNQGLLQATNQKEKINFTDPTKSDFLAFKGGGLEWSIPGMHSEIKTLGKILAVTFGNSKDISKLSHGKSKFEQVAEELGKYGLYKTNPAIGAGMETAQGHDLFGRPLPWIHEKIQKNKPPYGWPEYLLSHGPIPLQGPIRYAYDQLRTQGASATDSTAIIKALIIMGTDPKAIAIGLTGGTGMHISADYAAAKEAARREQIAQKLKGR